MLVELLCICWLWFGRWFREGALPPQSNLGSHLGMIMNGNLSSNWRLGYFCNYLLVWGRFQAMYSSTNSYPVNQNVTEFSLIWVVLILILHPCWNCYLFEPLYWFEMTPCFGLMPPLKTVVAHLKLTFASSNLLIWHIPASSEALARILAL